MFWLPAQLEPMLRRSFTVEAHQRLLVPLSIFSFVTIPLACLLPGELNRRGQLRRVLLAVGVAFLFQALDLGVKNLAGRNTDLIPLLYLVNLSPLVLGIAVLRFGLPRLRARRMAPAVG